MMMQENKIKVTAAAIAGLIFIFVGGCSFSINNEPRPRLGSYATSTPGTNFIDARNLGSHNYDVSLFEGNGIVYTCRGGHVDITHLRIYADYTRYLYLKTLNHLMKDGVEMTFKLNVEPSSYVVQFAYPQNWKSLPREDKKKIAEEVALELGQYFAYVLSTWHEILTFYGYKCMAVLPEEPSAFSWEDIYSNLLGIRLGAKALSYPDLGYNRAMTALIQAEMAYLGIQESFVARIASEKMRGKWFDGTVFVTMIRRNMDVGFDDGFVTPVLVPGLCGNVTPKSYPIPKLDAFNRYGFKMSFEVEPREFEKDSIMRIVYPDGGGKRVNLPVYLPTIMEAVKKEALKRHYVITDPNNGKS